VAPYTDSKTGNPDRQKEPLAGANEQHFAPLPDLVSPGKNWSKNRPRLILYGVCVPEYDAELKGAVVGSFAVHGADPSIEEAGLIIHYPFLDE
jgi:hypothetical protein